MASLKDNHNPQFVLFPVNNNRTGWKAFGLPVILVVPHRLDRAGIPIANSGVSNVRIFIEDVPQKARVVGHDNVGLFFPDRELYAENISTLELTDRAIDVSDLAYLRDGVVIDESEATYGDVIRITTSTGVTDTIDYLPDARYYDLSDITIDVEPLPVDRYNLVYNASYFTRAVSTDGQDQLLCINSNNTSLASLSFEINHPGDILNDMYNYTPPAYLTSATKSEDSTVAFYRPFADALQNIMDEQDLLGRANWVFDIQPELIPYLSSLLGWELPYFPQSLDKLRRALLRRTVEFQKLKGSRRAFVNLFRLFGFEILISNLWWSSDGQRFIRPGQPLPDDYSDEAITVSEKCQVDVLLSDYNSDGFGSFEIPLLYRPQQAVGFDDFVAQREGGNVSIDAYIVAKDSDAYDELIAISEAIQDDPNGYGAESGCTTDSDGFVNPTGIHSALAGKETVGYSQILISGKLGNGSDAVLAGSIQPLLKQNVTLDRDNNILSLTLNGAQQLVDDNRVVFAFATYKRQEPTIPAALTDLQSNRFDIQLLTGTLTEFADPVTLDFVLEFIRKIKAFHSLLNVIRHRVQLNETYEVTDFCFGGDIAQRYDTDLGRLQVPPAIIPDNPIDSVDCDRQDPKSIGYKDTDIDLRLRKISDLVSEFAAWQALDDRIAASGGDLRIALNSPIGDSCKYSNYGQSRVTASRETVSGVESSPSPNSNMMGGGDFQNNELSPMDEVDRGSFDNTGSGASSANNSGGYGSFMTEATASRDVLCELDGSTDYCYKGRVDDSVLYRPTMTSEEIVRCKPCSVSIGSGVYWTFPSFSKIAVVGTKTPCRGSKTDKIRFSGNAPDSTVQYFLTGAHGDYLNYGYASSLDFIKNSYLGRLLRDYGVPTGETLHYSNRRDPSSSQIKNLALERPQLDLQLPNLHFPGTRFPTLNRLEETFISSVWRAKPWDDEHSTYLGPITACCQGPDMLNATLIVGEDGDQYLQYDDEPFTVTGNGLVPDIPSLGDHILSGDEDFVASEVVHKIYMDDVDDRPWITLDAICDYGTDTSDGFIETDDPVFGSAVMCDTGAYNDFADGYPCLTGFQDLSEADLDRSGSNAALVEGLGVSDPDNTGEQILFYLESGIRDDSVGTRLDCGCSVYDCPGTDDPEVICNQSDYLDDDGEYDWNCDRVSMISRLSLEESIGGCSILLDGTIPTLLETND